MKDNNPEIQNDSNNQKIYTNKSKIEMKDGKQEAKNLLIESKSQPKKKVSKTSLAKKRNRNEQNQENANSSNYEENSNDETVASKVSEGKGIKKRSLKELEKLNKSDLSLILEQESIKYSTPLFRDFFSCLYSDENESILDKKFIHLLIEGIRCGDLKILLNSLLFDDNDCNILSECEELLSKYIDDLMSTFDYKLELAEGKGKNDSNRYLIERKLKREDKLKKSGKNEEKDSQILGKIKIIKKVENKNKLVSAGIIENSFKKNLLTKYKSFCNFLKIRFESWIKCVLLILIKCKISSEEGFKSFKCYTNKLKLKGQKMLINKKFYSCGPFVFLNQIKSIFNIFELKSEYEIAKEIRNYLQNYTLELIEILDKISVDSEEKISKEVNHDSIDSSDELNEEIDNKTKNFDIAYFIRRIEKRTFECTDKRMKVIFDKYKDYTFKSCTSLEYSVPDISETKLIIPKESQKEVKKDILSLFLKIKASFYNEGNIVENKCVETDQEKLKPTPFNFQRTINSKEVMSRLEKYKKFRDAYYQNEICNQIKNQASRYVAKVKKLCEVNHKFVNNSKAIKDFDCEKQIELEKIISDHINQTKLISIQILKDCKLQKSEDHKICINQLAEIAYGGYSSFLELKLDKECERNELKKLMLKRSKTILYILRHPVLTNWKKSTFSNDLLSFIINEMEDNENNKRKDGVVGEQSETFLKVETVLMLPFECLMKCNPNRGKLFILENRN